MIKKKIDKTRLGGGVRHFEVSQGKRLWLSLILAFLCAALLCCAFVLPKNNKSANAATAYPVNQSVFSGTIVGAYALSSSDKQNPTKTYAQLSTSTVAASVADISFTPGVGTMSAKSDKKNNGHAYTSYIKFQADIVVPANTEYEVTYTFTLSVTSGRSSSVTSAELGTHLLCFGDTDISSSLSFICGPSTPSKTYDIGSLTGKVPYNPTPLKITKTIKHINNTNVDDTFTTYFGFSAGNNYNGGGATMTFKSELACTGESIVVKALEPDASVHATVFEKPYTGSPIDFNTYYNHTLVEPTAVIASDFDGQALKTPVSLSDIDLSTGIFTATLAGYYSITFELTSIAKADGIAWADGTTDPKTIQYTIKRKQVTVPELIGDKAKEYDDGNGVEFDFSGVSEFVKIVADTMNVGTVDDNGYCTLSATDVGDYPVSFKLKDTKNTEWATGGVADKTLDGGLKITPKTAILSATVDGGEWKWEKDTEKEVTITASITNEVDLPKLKVQLTYSKTGSAPKTVTATYDTDSGKFKATIPGIRQVDDYTLTVGLASDGNYVAEEKTYPFKVTGTKAPFDEEYLVWRYTVDGKMVEMVDFEYDENGVVQLKYVGSEYEFSVDEEVLLHLVGPSGQTARVKVSDKGFTGDKKATVVKTAGDGIYTVTVYIVGFDKDTDFDETPFSLKYKINPAEFDADKLVWVYQYLGDGDAWQRYEADNLPEDKDLEVTLKLMYEVDGELQDLPAVLKPTYSEVKRSGKGTYNAKVTFISLDSNYKAPEDITFSWEITAEVINIEWDEEASLEDEDGVYLTPLLKNYKDYEGIVQYEFTRLDNGESGFGIETLKKFWEEAGSTKMIPVRVTVSLIDGQEENYLLRGTTSVDFEVGDTKTRATLTVEASGHYSEMQLTIAVKQDNDKEVLKDRYTVNYYKDGVLLENFDVNTADAGTYEVGIVFNSPYDLQYVRVAKKSFVIEEKPVDIPEIAEITFTGLSINLEEYFNAAFKKLIEDGIVTVTSGATQRNAGPYTAYLELSKNYKWNLPDNEELAPVRFALASDEVTPVINGSELQLPWTINRAKLVSNWNLKGADGAKNTALSAWQNKINDGTVSVGIDYRYYDNSKVQLAEVEFKAGTTFFVDAFLTGDDADNFEFDGGIGESKQATPMVEYTVPRSGFAAAMSAVKDFATKTWLGLPVWAWLLIGLALLILLIIIIVVACKRKKNKEERKEEKARREEERRMQQERLQAERDLAKAKQEAELEKIKAQAQMVAGMAGMGMASMTMQMPQQHAMPAPQQMPMQQPVQQQAQPQMQPMVQQMPQSQPVMQQPAPAQASGGVGATEMMAMMFAQFAGMKADAADKEIAALKSDKEITALRTELEIMKLKMEQLKDDKKVISGENKREFTPEYLGALIASAMRENVLSQSANAAELPATAEPDTANMHTVYPPDAVVTTTTTVDTTQKPLRRERDGGRSESGFSDVDGFYDSID